jgi:glycosyltransferase involved in cell wall biosynthesis
MVAMGARMDRLRIFTWHVHGNYLYYLTQTPHEFYLPVGRPSHGYAGRAAGFPWSDRVHDIHVDHIRDSEFDCVLFQSRQHYLSDQYDVLSDRQRRLPAIFLEHDPPQEHPTNTRHVVDDPSMLLVHVTPFNALMWDSNRTPVRIIEHGVVVPQGLSYQGDLAKGLVIINGLRKRGRRLGADIFEQARRRIPLDLIGMQSEELGGLGEISHDDLPRFMLRYRFLFNPIRYTSLGLAVCESMALGLPVVGLATTEMSTAVENGVSGYVHTSIESLIERMRHLLDHPDEAQRLSDGARQAGRARFDIARFANDWDRVFSEAVRQGRDVSSNLVRNGEPLIAGRSHP